MLRRPLSTSFWLFDASSIFLKTCHSLIIALTLRWRPGPLDDADSAVVGKQRR